MSADHAPRIAPIAEPELRRRLPRLVAALDSLDLLGRRRPRNAAGQLGHHPDAAAPTFLLSHALLNGHLPPRLRELAIVRTAAHWRACYPWSWHYLIGRQAGLTDRELIRASEGSGANGWAAHERLILAATEQLLTTGDIDDPTWGLLAARHGPRELVELVLVVTQFSGNCVTTKALRTPLEKDAQLAPVPW